MKRNDNIRQNIQMEMTEYDNDSREAINSEPNTIQFLNRESNAQKINVNLFNNKSSNITNDNNIKSSINTMSYDMGPVTNSVMKQSQNIRKSIESDDYYISDYK